MAAVIDAGQVVLDPVHRFENGVIDIDGHLRWNITALFNDVIDGLTELARRYPHVESIGIDTWAVDYGLLDDAGRLLAQPIAYRDPRTESAVSRVHSIISRAELFQTNGLQFLPFNTLYQLAVEQTRPLWSNVAHIVLLPDLVAYWLTGNLRTEYTNATTTGLVDVHTKDWSATLLDRLGINAEMLPPIEQPGSTRGSVLTAVAERIGLHASTAVITVGSHDTASAVVAVPATGPAFAYVASGTWSLVGVELSGPVMSDEALAANFTNEGGVDGRIRFLRNVGGLWLLQESMRAWAEQGFEQDLHTLLEGAAALAPGGPLIDVDDAAFIAPGDMPIRITAAIAASAADGPRSMTPAAIVRCILDSLADAYAETVRTASALSGCSVDVIHIVGGGSQNALLCQLTADAAQLCVVAGPVEATALGNALIQARAIGAVPAELDGLRAIVAASTRLTRYEPCPTR